MRINDEELLKQMRKETDKSKRVNSYKVKYMKHDGNYVELTFNQGYDASTDCFNPFFVRVYDENRSYVMGGVNSTIEGAYNDLITSLILYLTEARNANNENNKKLAKIGGILGINEDDNDDRF